MTNDSDNVELFNKGNDKGINPYELNLQALDALLLNNIEQTRRYEVAANANGKAAEPELTKDQRVEAFAQQLGKRLGADNLRPIYGACYAGIDFEKLEDLAEQAVAKGREPIRLFMYLVKKEPKWTCWQQGRR